MYDLSQKNTGCSSGVILILYSKIFSDKSLTFFVPVELTEISVCELQCWDKIATILHSEFQGATNQKQPPHLAWWNQSTAYYPWTGSRPKQSYFWFLCFLDNSSSLKATFSQVYPVKLSVVSWYVNSVPRNEGLTQYNVCLNQIYSGLKFLLQIPSLFTIVLL